MFWVPAAFAKESGGGANEVPYSIKLVRWGVIAQCAEAGFEDCGNQEKNVDYFLIGAIAWLAFFALWGMFTGFWRSLAGAVGVVLAYWASLEFAPGLSAVIERQFPSLNLHPTAAWVLGATVIFFVFGFVVRQLVLLISKRLPIGNGLFNRLGGGVISTAYGAVLGVAMIWGLAFMAESWNIRVAEAGAERAARFDISSPVVTWSRRLMAEWVNWNLRHSGSSEFAELSAVMAEKPGEVLSGVRMAVQSPEFRQMSSSARVQEMVQRRDAESLRKSAEFRQFIEQPAVQRLRETLAPESGSWSDDRIAQELVTAWSRLDQLKSQPEMADVLNDEELQAFLRGEGQITPSLLARSQRLLVLLDRKVKVEETVVPEPQWFQWHDDEGHLHVTEFESVPEDKKSSAQPVNFREPANESQ
jgi:uncharacterized membrane protein required for colicin V production